MSAEPLVTVVSPFYNTADYLRECIESVLNQSYKNFEYLLVNNKSTDGSREIALEFACKDKRVRLIDNDQFVSQLENYNGALKQIDPRSKYVKFCSADDVLYPRCIAEMVRVAESDPAIGLVISQYMMGRLPVGLGFPEVSKVNGREAAKHLIRTGSGPLGTPTTVLYRADLIKKKADFFLVGHYHADTEAAYEILKDNDLGLAREALCFVRSDNESITKSRRPFHPNILDHYIITEKFGHHFLGGDFGLARDKIQDEYFRFLGRAALRVKGKEFWDYHKAGLATINQKLDWFLIAASALKEVKRLSTTPVQTLRRAITDIQHRME